MAEVKCKECGWQGSWSEVPHTILYEEWGDVDCLKCPNCRRVEYEGMEMFEDITDERKK